MVKEDSEDESKRVIVYQIAITNKNFENFVSTRSWAVFQKLTLHVDFLDAGPEYWELRKDFQEALEKVQALNNHPEHGMALIQEFSGHFTKDEPKQLYLLQIVEKDRKDYPDSRKETLVGPK